METMISNLLFLGFSSLMLISAFCVITLQHPVRSVLSLVVCFFAAAGLWMLLTAEFLSLILILVYVGAVMTLFLFVVMTLNQEIKSTATGKLNLTLPLGILLCALLAAILVIVLHHSVLTGVSNELATSISTVSNTRQLGNVLYTEYSLPFEITAVILLAAMIAAISLTVLLPTPHRKQQDISKQINVKKQDRVRLVK